MVKTFEEFIKSKESTLEINEGNKYEDILKNAYNHMKQVSKKQYDAMHEYEDELKEIQPLLCDPDKIDEGNDRFEKAVEKFNKAFVEHLDDEDGRQYSIIVSLSLIKKTQTKLFKYLLDWYRNNKISSKDYLDTLKKNIECIDNFVNNFNKNLVELRDIYKDDIIPDDKLLELIKGIKVFGLTYDDELKYDSSLVVKKLMEKLKEINK